MPLLYDVSVVVPAFAQPSYQLDQEFLRVVIDDGGHVDVDGDVVIAGTARTVGHALAAEPQLLAARRAGRDLDLRLAVDRRDRGDGAEHRAIERDAHVVVDVVTFDLEPRAVRGLDLGLERLASLRFAARVRITTTSTTPARHRAVVDLDVHALPTSAALCREELAE